MFNARDNQYEDTYVSHRVVILRSLFSGQCHKENHHDSTNEILKDKGLKELYHLKGGIREWQAAGYQVEKI